MQKRMEPGNLILTDFQYFPSNAKAKVSMLLWEIVFS